MSEERRKMKTGIYKNRSKKIAWKSDYDYAEKLNDSDKAFLNAFNRGYYNGDFRTLEKLTNVSKEFKSEAYNSQYKGRCDVLNNFKTIEFSTLQAPEFIDEN